MKTVLIIDNNHEYREAFRDALQEEGLDVFDADCPDAAFAILRASEPPDLIVCDLYLPFTTGERAGEFKTSCEVGLKTMHELAWVYPEATVIALAALSQQQLNRLKPYLGNIPAYTKPAMWHDAADIVSGFLASDEWGGVQ